MSGAEIDARAAERLTFFSDAVVAIAMTLLALELPVPVGNTASELWNSTYDHHRGAYIAFLLSFWVIARHWRSHHRAFRYIARADHLLFSLNLIWLFRMVITPFVTKLVNNETAIGALIRASLPRGLRIGEEHGEFVVICPSTRRPSARRLPPRPRPRLGGGQGSRSSVASWRRVARPAASSARPVSVMA